MKTPREAATFLLRNWERRDGITPGERGRRVSIVWGPDSYPPNVIAACQLRVTAAHPDYQSPLFKLALRALDRRLA